MGGTRHGPRSTVARTRSTSNPQLSKCWSSINLRAISTKIEIISTTKRGCHRKLIGFGLGAPGPKLESDEFSMTTPPSCRDIGAPNIHGTLRAPGRAYLTWGPIHAGLAIEVQGGEGSADEYQWHVADTYYL